MGLRVSLSRLAKFLAPQLQDFKNTVFENSVSSHSFRTANRSSVSELVNFCFHSSRCSHRGFSTRTGSGKTDSKDKSTPDVEENSVASYLAPDEDDEQNLVPPKPEELPPNFFENQHDISDDDFYSMLLMKDVKGMQGLPPLNEILEMDEKGEKKKARREMEEKKQQEIKELRIQEIDKLGRAYATGRRKCSVARVWVFEGKGKLTVNGKSHDMYFPEIDYRTALLEPFSVTNTLGKFDVWSTTCGGGKSGQAGAVRHGISRALQRFDPTLRPALKSAGYLTRDPRMVERKKPGKAKARKSFQWVKR